jgi:hypothetical protein
MIRKNGLWTVLFFVPFLFFSAGALLFFPGCKKPQMPSLTGEGRFHDLSQIRYGMSPNEVRRIMGSNYKTLYKEGIQGIDSGIYIWEYKEGRIHFDPDGVTKIEPFGGY